jgi:predicted RNase H-like HicB family nuclease
MPRRKASNKMVEFAVDVVVEPDDDQYHAYCPALRGLHVGGATEEEALSNARDAVEAYLKSLIKHGDPIPVGVATETVVPPKRAHSHHMQHLAMSLDELEATHITL